MSILQLASFTDVGGYLLNIRFVITNIIIVSSYIALCDLCHKETVCKSKDTPADWTAAHSITQTSIVYSAQQLHTLSCGLSIGDGWVLWKQIW